MGVNPRFTWVPPFTTPWERSQSYCVSSEENVNIRPEPKIRGRMDQGCRTDGDNGQMSLQNG